MREHEKLLVYPKLMEAMREIEQVARRIPDSHRDPAEKAKFYRFSRRSVGECHTALDLCDTVLPSPPPTARPRALLDEVSMFTTKLITAQRRRQVEARRSPAP